jgi:hypothetical protein
MPQNNKFTQSFFTIIAIILSLYVGYLYGNRDFVVGNTPINITTQGDGGYKENFFSDMRIANVVGFSNPKDTVTFGKLYYKIKDAKTYIKIDLNNLPATLNNPDIDKSIDLPLKLKVELASDNSDKTDYEYYKVGDIELSSNENNEINGSFTTILDFDLDSNVNSGLRRLVIKSGDEAQQNIFFDTDSQLPINIRGQKSTGIEPQPAPYFWVKF